MISRLQSGHVEEQKGINSTDSKYENKLQMLANEWHCTKMQV